MNALCQADVSTEGGLFTTLDPTTRRLTLPDRSTVLLTDTVGFIRKLPPTIINAFRATLEELSEASLLLHVVDLASPDAPEQCQTVEAILGDLKLADRPRITVLNKIDLLRGTGQTWDEETALAYLSGKGQAADKNTVLISATRRWGISGLLKLVTGTLGNPEIYFQPPPTCDIIGPWILPSLSWTYRTRS